MKHTVFLDVVLIFGATFFWFAIVSAFQAWMKRPKKPAKGNPFRQFKDWQVRQIVTKP